MSAAWFRLGGKSKHNIWMEGDGCPDGGVQIGCMFDPVHAAVVVDALNMYQERLASTVIATVGPVCTTCGGSMLIPKENSEQVPQ